MSVLLFVIGAITLVLGALTIGFGIPINEFSFGNTLIMAGTTAAVGGMIVIGLGAVVAHLQRVAEVLAMRTPVRPVRGPETAEAGRVPTASHLPFAPKPTPEPAMGEAPPVEPPLAAAAMLPEEFAARAEAPTLPNPDMPPLEEAEEMPPAPPSFAAMPHPGAEPGEPAFASRRSSGFNGSGAEEQAGEPLPAWLSAPPLPEPPRGPEEARFEAVWPAAEERTAGRPARGEAEPMAAAPTAPEVEPEAAAPENERRSVAVLKSGIVDGMAYTLYVDGSIEAELPQGTLRFASINELREHLERTS